MLKANAECHDAMDQVGPQRAGEIEHGAEEAALHDVDEAWPRELCDARRVACWKHGSAGVSHERINQRHGAEPKSDLQSLHVAPVRQESEINRGLLAHILGGQ